MRQERQNKDQSDRDHRKLTQGVDVTRYRVSSALSKTTSALATQLPSRRWDPTSNLLTKVHGCPSSVPPHFQ